MAKAIIARRKGDEYQARFLWLKLLQLRTDDHTETVTFEGDEVPFLDDVVVSYGEPKKEKLTGKRIIRDLFQCKYHMRSGNAFTIENLIDPGFINSKTSMLKRLHKAYLSLSDELGTDSFRLYIVSSWNWHPDGILSKHCHEEMICTTFFEKGPKSAEGKARSKLAEHLSVSEEDLQTFLDTVRFTLGRNLSDLEQEMNLHLKLAGLKPINSTVTNICYDDLAWKLFAQGKHSFDKDKFNEMIHEEDLIKPDSIKNSEISIQSFSQFARRPSDLQMEHLDLRNFFDERFVKNDSYWKKEIPDQISAFMLNEKLGNAPQPIHLFFDCHLSIAFFAGHLISPKHRIQILPIQKSKSDYALWDPSVPDTDTELWNIQTVGEISEELILGISVTHSIQKQMQPYLETVGLADLSQYLVYPTKGTGLNAISDGNYAWQLAYQLKDKLHQIIPNTCRKIHLFFAGPVALGYILGHTLRHIVPVFQLYEHDFEGLRYKNRYYPSLQVPYQP